MKLMIIESPGKIEKLTPILGAGWMIAASVGHIRALPINEMGVEAPNFIPRYELIPAQPIPGQPGKFYPSAKERVARLKQLVNSADTVYLATDPDREGEAIAWHLKECLGLSNPKRVTFNEITATAVNAGLKAPRTIDMNLVAAQEARQVLDRLVGYSVSPVLIQMTGQKLSAGRVQSPAVFLVVERERQIKAFRPTSHFGAMLYFGATENEWSAEWLVRPNFVTEDSPYFMDKTFATAITEVKAVTVKTFDEREARRSPPPPFNTSLMLQAASVALGLDPKITMQAAQKLNEQGHITYHRTDNPNVSDESLKDIYAEAAKLGLDVVEKPRKFPCPEGAQIGHPAITPTHWDKEDAGETSDQRALHKLIRLRAIACQLADARYKVRTVRLEAAQPVQGKTVEFEGKGRTLIYSGWLKLIGGDQTDEEGEKEATNPIPVVKPGQILDVAHGELLAKKTKAPSRYTLASLVKQLESEGIGRPSTYAALTDLIVSRGYVKAKKYLEPNPSAELIVDSLVGKFKFMDLGFTRDVEKTLDLIAQGKAGFKDVIQKVYAQLQSELATLGIQGMPAPAAVKAKCPKCKGAVTADARTLSCQCGFKLWREIAGLRLTDEQCETLLSTRTLPNTPGFKSGKTGKPFSTGLKLAADLSGKVEFVFEARPPAAAEGAGADKVAAPDSATCPKCKKPMRQRTGGKGLFWGCSGYPECKVTATDNNGKMGKITGYT